MSMLDKIIDARARAIMGGATPQHLQLRITRSALGVVFMSGAPVEGKLLGMPVEIVPDFEVVEIREGLR